MDYRKFKNKYKYEVAFSNKFSHGSEYKITPDLLQLYDVVETFKTEMIQWYDNERADKENPFSCATQELWYGMYLEKKRLEKREIRMVHKIFRPASSKSGRRSNLLEFYHDGKYRVNMLGQMTVYDVHYIRNNSLLGVVDSFGGYDHMLYYVLRARNKNGLYICPNCGGEATLDKLLDGCDYCSSKFDISAFNDKVICLNRVQRKDDSRSEDDEIFITTRLTWLLCLACVLFVVTILLAIPILAVGLYHIHSLKENKACTEQFFIEIYKRNPGTSKEELIASLDNKIKMIYFADHPGDVAAFVKCDISAFIQANQNIIRCQTGRFKIINYTMDAKYQYMEVERSVRGWRDFGNCMQSRKDIIKMKLAKRIDHKIKNEISMYTCQHCGATISLTEGGICKYCGAMMEYDTYDWVIIGFNLVK